ncbi:beta-1%2C6-galactofuranosyltransferase [Anaerostipes hadrus]|uniref:Beta-1,6-galactofuranosyltransferase n=1 Tax=Anaerostipes hadrus TaxID=649756 RepID=A0A173RAG3_ANAHA|nr:sugar transferase [Anaerostipes hadrus]CUM74777.1 beta-1%2C6-galactofuranosyltransferase [Anaerostipes hadrus]
MKIYQLVENITNDNTAGSKAVIDIIEVANELGFKKLYIKNCERQNNFLKKIYRQISFFLEWKKIYNQVDEGDVILLQHPFRVKQFGREKFLKNLKLKKNIKYISLVHDVEELRKSLYNEYYEKEFAIMCMLADVIIVHNDKMKDFFVKKGIPKEKLVVLEIFDYLQKKDSNKTKKYFEKQITVAGNLDINKCKYIGELCKLNKIKIQLYGPNFDNKMKKYSNIQYGGSVPSDIIPKKLISGFGLVWDGNSLEGCRGNTGQYLKYNNPHKLSLYLSSGLPVVVWSQAAEAQFIETNEVGLVVDSLFELQEKLSNMTAKQYDLYAKKTKKIANLLVNGYYTKTALAKALDLIKMEI